MEEPSSIGLLQCLCRGTPASDLRPSFFGLWRARTKFGVWGRARRLLQDRWTQTCLALSAHLLWELPYGVGLEDSELGSRPLGPKPYVERMGPSHGCWYRVLGAQAEAIFNRPRHGISWLSSMGLGPKAFAAAILAIFAL